MKNRKNDSRVNKTVVRKMEVKNVNKNVMADAIRDRYQDLMEFKA